MAVAPHCTTKVTVDGGVPGKVGINTPPEKNVVDPAATGAPSGRPTGHAEPPVVTAQVTVVQTNPADTLSETVLLFAALGPLLLKVTVYAVVLPAGMEVTPSVLVTFKFALKQLGVVTVVAVLLLEIVSPTALEIATVLVCGLGTGVQITVSVTTALSVAKSVAPAIG